MGVFSGDKIGFVRLGQKWPMMNCEFCCIALIAVTGTSASIKNSCFLGLSELSTVGHNTVTGQKVLSS